MIYIAYGAPKSGSSLTFELTRAMFDVLGYRPIVMSAEARGDRSGKAHYTNTIREFTPDVVAAVEGAEHADTILLLRSHHGASPAIASLIERGLAKHMVGIRDPRDIALSMLDVVVRLAEQKGRSHPTIRAGDLSSTLKTIEANIARITSWADIPGGLILNYEQTAFDHTVTLDAICRQLGLDAPRDSYGVIFERATKRMSGKVNVAKPHRHRRQMSAADQADFLRRFKPFYDRFYPQATVVVDESANA